MERNFEILTKTVPKSKKNNEKTRKELIKYVNDGSIDLVTCDQCPIDIDNKKQLTSAMESMIKNYNQYEPEKLKSIAHQFSMDNVGKKINQEYISALI